ncbi:MAG: hypothetical protein LBS53_09615 [Synergistaceae bacterium]|nr:hypothetical protein [Synergistaceae bacterium]
MTKDTDFFQSGWFYANSQDKFGEKRVDDYLRKQAERSEYAKIYYEKAKELDAWLLSPQPVPTFEEVLAKVRGQESFGRGIVVRFARNAGPEQIEKLAQAAMNEINEKIQLKLLHPFQFTAKYSWTKKDGAALHKYSFPDEFLARLRESDNGKLREAAYDIIGGSPSQETRELALSLTRSGKDVANGILLLSKNLRPADEALLCAAVKSLPIRNDGDTWHTAFSAARDGIEVMRGKPKTDILEYIYRNTLCGTCREFIIRLMHKKKTLPEAILRECQFDSNSDVWAIAERIIKHRRKS